MLTEYLQKFKASGEVYLRIKARPGAASTEVRGLLQADADETIKIDIAAAPEHGKANAELIRYLAIWFGVQKANVQVLSGASDKLKLVKITK